MSYLKNKENIKKLFYSEEKIQIKMKKCTESVYLQFEVDCNALKEKNENIMIINLERGGGLSLAVSGCMKHI